MGKRGEVLLQAGLPERPPLWGTGDWDSSPALSFQGLLGAGLQMQITLAITHRRTFKKSGTPGWLS